MEKTLSKGVIITISRSAHALIDLMHTQLFFDILTGILNSLVGVKDQSWLDAPFSYGLPAGFEYERRVLPVA